MEILLQPKSELKSMSDEQLLKYISDLNLALTLVQMELARRNSDPERIRAGSPASQKPMR